jgi:hypothetical protein
MKLNFNKNKWKRIIKSHNERKYIIVEILIIKLIDSNLMREFRVYALKILRIIYFD